MNYNASVAAKCFRENTNLIDPNRQPIEWNNANGLLHLAQSVDDLATEIDRLKQQIQNLEFDVRRLK